MMTKNQMHMGRRMKGKGTPLRGVHAGLAVLVWSVCVCVEVNAQGEDRHRKFPDRKKNPQLAVPVVAPVMYQSRSNPHTMLPGNKIPPPSKASSTLGHLLDVGPDPKTPNADKNIVPLDTDGEQGAISQNMSEGMNEKGSEDAGVTEKAPSETAKADEGLKIAADLKTEAGSHYGDGEDPALLVSDDQDMVKLPVHSQLDLGGQGTVEDRRRELAQAMAEHIVQAALLAGSRNNITVMVALLPGCGV